MKTIALVYAIVIFAYASQNKCRILALGGGGTKGAFQAGAIEGLVSSMPREERSYDYVTGVSVGSLNMMELVLTEKGEEETAIQNLKELWYNIKLENIFVNWPLGLIDGFFFKKGAFDSSPEKILIEGIIKGRDYKRKFQFSTTDMSAGSVLYFDESMPKSKIVNYLLSSTALPGALPYQELDGTQMSDGGCNINVNIFGAINRCIKDGFDEEDIIVDSIVTNAKKPLYSNMSGAAAYQMVIRYFKMNSYIQTWHDIYDAVMAYPDVKFRYLISPTKSLPEYPVVPLNFKTEDLITMYAMGVEDGKNAVMKSKSNFKAEYSGMMREVMALKYGNAIESD